ncbi:MAG: glycosyltransferase family 2 protein, partial [Saprospiraceae bacterium]
MGLLDKLPQVTGNKTGWPWTEETDINIYDPNKEYPKISIVTPSYNQGQFIEETIRGVLLQNYPNLEYIVIDGGSTDETVEIIKKYEPWLTYWVSEKDRGQSHAINKGIEKCTGEINSWINSDDFYEKEAFHNLVNSFDTNHHLYIGIGHKIDVEKNIRYTPKLENIGYEYFVQWMDGNNFMQPAAFFTKAAISKVGGLNEKYNYCMDVDLWLRISREFKIKKIDKTLAYAYIHEDAKTTADVLEMRIETCLLMCE